MRNSANAVTSANDLAAALQCDESLSIARVRRRADVGTLACYRNCVNFRGCEPNSLVQFPYIRAVFRPEGGVSRAWEAKLTTQSTTNPNWWKCLVAWIHGTLRPNVHGWHESSPSGVTSSQMERQGQDLQYLHQSNFRR